MSGILGAMTRAAVLLVVLLLGCSSTDSSTPIPAAPTPAPKPDAALRIEAKSLAAALGYSWGKGTLEYQGKSYPVTMNGVTILAVGFTSVSASGSVYHLSSLDDFDGRYTAPLGASALGEGGAGVVMRNEKGVEVRLVATNTGVTLSIGDAGVTLALEK